MTREEIIKLIENILSVRGYTPLEDARRVVQELQRVGIVKMDEKCLEEIMKLPDIIVTIV